MPSRRTRQQFDLHTARQVVEAGEAEQQAENQCPLCGRTIPPQAKSSRHHLVPRLKGGAKLGTVLLHQICHSAIHARFSEAELARHFSDIEALRNAPEMADFLRWVRTKPDDFHVRTSSARTKSRPRQKSPG